MLNNIKSKDVLQLIIKTYLSRIKSLSLLNYNKHLQNILNITKKDFELLNLIEIELIPINQLKNKKNNFICNNSNNLFMRQNLSFYHFFFDSNKSETKKDFITKDEKVNKIKIVIDKEEKSLRGLFTFCECLKEINFIKFRRKDIVDMREMFAFCKSLSKINFIDFRTNNVIKMSQMFRSCLSLIELDL